MWSMFMKNNKLDYSKYESILEYIPTIKDRIIDCKLDINNNLVEIIKDFYNTNTHPIIVSLSGGVDSMVIITILKWLGYNVIAVFINYNNRDESLLEQEFLTNWCEYNNIKFYVKEITHINRNNTKRTQYEIESKNIRFQFYKTIMFKDSAIHVVLAHHKDDVIENIFANICRGRNILDLAIIRESAVLSGVNIARPFVNIYKDEIINFALQFQVPYFLDTTPGWSVRGKYRTNILPLLTDTFTHNVKQNLINISRQADDWNELIQNEIVLPFIETVTYNYNDCEFMCERYNTYPVAFWNQVFMKIFYHYGKNIPSHKAVKCFMDCIKTKNVCYISLSNECTCRNINYKIKIVFK